MFERFILRTAFVCSLGIAAIATGAASVQAATVNATNSVVGTFNITGFAGPFEIVLLSFLNSPSLPSADPLRLDAFSSFDLALGTAAGASDIASFSFTNGSFNKTTFTMNTNVTGVVSTTIFATLSHIDDPTGFSLNQFKLQAFRDFQGTLSFNADSISDLPTSVIPVPTALPLFLTGLGALGLIHWRRGKAAV